MESKIHISASLVLYKEDVKTLQKCLNSFLETPLTKILYVLDNSPTNSLKQYCQHPEINYQFVGKNIGFAQAHNLVLSLIKEQSEAHLVLNPDTVYNTKVLGSLLEELNKNEALGLIAPKVVSPSGALQYTCRKNPTLFELACRTLGIFKKLTEAKEYRNRDLSKAFYPEFIYGCFMLFKTADFIRIGGFDERYFLYMEDADICRTLLKNNRKILFFPQERITHIHRRGSSKSIKLAFFHIISAIKYSLKW